MASTTWVAPDAGRRPGFALGVDGADNQALRHQWQTAPNDGRSRWASLGTPGGEPADVAGAGMAASNFHRRHERCAAGKL
jgi:hypothetical protein